MNMHDKNKFNEYAVDIELLRFEMLIEQREIYEENFFSLEPFSKEFEYAALQNDLELQNQEINYILDDFENDLVNPLDYEDYQNQLRDIKLIEDREKYESIYFSHDFDDFAINDIFDCQIAAMENDAFIEEKGYEYDYNFDVDSYEDYIYDEYEEEMFWKLHYLKLDQFQKPTCGCAYIDYMPHDDGFCDYLDCYDYPDGPDENLSGVKFY